MGYSSSLKVLFIVIGTQWTYINCSPCGGTDWDYVDNRCLQVPLKNGVPDKIDWLAARDKCVTLGGDLAHPKNLEDIPTYLTNIATYLEGIMNSANTGIFGSDAKVWLGGLDLAWFALDKPVCPVPPNTDFPNKGEWRWNNGLTIQKPVDATTAVRHGWKPSNPGTPTADDQRCLYIMLGQPAGSYMGDKSCNEPFPFVCQKRLTKIPEAYHTINRRK